MAKYTTKETTKANGNSETKEVKETKETKVKEPTVQKRQFEQNEGISCRSVVQGGVYLTGTKTKMPYEWTAYGDRTEVEYCDLVALVRERSGYLFSPFIIVEDDDFVAEFPQLQKFYSENYSIKELSSILELPLNEMEQTIATLPRTALDSLKNIAANQVSLGQIDSVSKIKVLDRIFGTDLNLISEIMK